MTTALLLVFALLLAGASARPRRTPPAWARHLHGWQKVFGVVALVLAVLMLMNPEFLALGLLGDTALLDVLVLTLSLQLHSYATRFVRRAAEFLRSGWQWLGIPSPGLLYLGALSAAALASVVSTFQKTAQRIFS